MAYRETMENNGMEAGRAKNQIPYCTVVLVALNVILFLIGLILPKAGEWMESEGCFSVVYLLYEHSGFYRGCVRRRFRCRWRRKRLFCWQMGSLCGM